MSTKSPEKFGELLTEGVKRIQIRESGKNLSHIEDELAFSIGRDRGASTIKYWRNRHIPAKEGEVKALAMEIVQRDGGDQKWLCEFLAAAGLPEEADELIAQLFPQTETAKIEPQIQQQTGLQQIQPETTAIDESVWQTRVIEAIAQPVKKATPLHGLQITGWVGLFSILVWVIQPLRMWQLDGLQLTILTITFILAPVFVTWLTLPSLWYKSERDNLMARLSYAAAGFNIASTFLIMGIFFYPAFTVSLIPAPMLWLLPAVSLMVSHIWLMNFNRKWKPHGVDGYVLAVCSIISPMIIFSLQRADAFASRNLLGVFIFALIGVLIMSQKNKNPDFLPDIVTIALVGIILPLAGFTLIVLEGVKQGDEFGWLTSSTAVLYFTSIVLLAVTISLRQSTDISMGSLAYFALVSNALYFSYELDRLYIVLIIIVVALFGGLYLRNKPYFRFQIHLSGFIFILITIISSIIARRFPAQLYISSIFLVVSTILNTTFAYRKIPNRLTLPKQ